MTRLPFHRATAIAALGAGAVLAGSAVAAAVLHATGPVPVAELDQRAQAYSAAADRDRDGFLTADELRTHWQAVRRQRAEARFAHMDLDADGRVSVAEFSAARAARVRRLDANGDGLVDRDEWLRGRRATVAPPG